MLLKYHRWNSPPPSAGDYPWWGADQQRNSVFSDPDILYSINSHGYRCAEFSHSLFQNQGWCFGDSFCFGVGVQARDTLAEQLNFLNLGVCGASIEMIAANSLRLHRLGLQPNAVVYIWPTFIRLCQWITSDIVQNWNASNIEHAPEHIKIKTLDDPQQTLNSAVAMIRNIKELWTVPQVHFCWDLDLSSAADLIHIKSIDKARDGGHPGPQSQQKWAQEVRNIINLHN